MWTTYRVYASKADDEWKVEQTTHYEWGDDDLEEFGGKYSNSERAFDGKLPPPKVEIVHDGLLCDCYAFIQLREKGYL